ncbi:hypothetical protein C8N40_111136 [Pontibacter mucosus]|uniref:Uncharacterized protein n=1 Tax=Pontibacter mucosus TaxID=1649266 RepID=A0A2T5YD78_9BACT|nr:hypothetical protein [Pontibacter mucosus]PTX14471.1 hypothetical protein C8N40_111136 [Pontibacter mucosus]
MGRGDKFIHLRVIWLAAFVLVAFYLHELFQFVYYDVLHVNARFFGVEVYSLIPFHPYPDTVQLDIQVYVWEVGVHVIMLLLVHMLHHAVHLLNALDNPIPGYHEDSLRLIKGLRYFFVMQMVLYLFFHGQQDEVYDLVVIFVCFVTPFLKRTLPQRLKDAQK